jgi:hypothetical protein
LSQLTRPVSLPTRYDLRVRPPFEFFDHTLAVHPEIQWAPGKPGLRPLLPNTTGMPSFAAK